MTIRFNYHLALLGMLVACLGKAEIHITPTQEGLLIKSEYGTELIRDQVVIDLIQSPVMERTKLLNQYGITQYIDAYKGKPFSRFEHSIGVFMLLRRFGASIQEQIDGLLHDVSHTVFSHVGDFVFNSYFDRYSYQDDIHEWFLIKMGANDIFAAHGLDIACVTQCKSHHRIS